MMTRRDYVLIAGVLASVSMEELSGDDCVEFWITLVDRFAAALAADNIRFDATRFRKACEPTG